MITDTGDEIQLKANSWDPFARVIYLAAIPANAKTVDITFSVQKMRSVEFFVRPPKRIKDLKFKIKD